MTATVTVVRTTRLRFLDTTEVAELLDVQRRTVNQWRFRDILPEPDLVVSGRPAWMETTITGWARETGRL